MVTQIFRVFFFANITHKKSDPLFGEKKTLNYHVLMSTERMISMHAREELIHFK